MKESEAETWLAAIVSSSDDAIVGKRLDGTIVTWNEGASRVFGYSAEEMIGQSILKLFPPELKDEEKFIIGRLTQGERVEHYETTRVRKGGQRIDVSVSVSPIRGRDGTIVGAAKIARDVSESKRLRESLRKLNEELEAQLEESQAMAGELEDLNAQLEEALEGARRAQESADSANRVKSQFLATMSHELRTPLNAIIGYVDLLESGVHGPMPAGYNDYVARICKSQKHLLALIEGLLDFSRLEAGRIRFTITDVRVSGLLARLEPLVEMQAREKEHRLELVPPRRDLIVSADEDRALQILINLVSNAIKFTPRRGAIEVTAMELSKEDVAISVRDSGPGISTADQERIFEPFVQVDDTLTRQTQGAGLGLSISRQLAHAMNGQITVESTPGKGSVFTLVLSRGSSVSE